VYRTHTHKQRGWKSKRQRASAAVAVRLGLFLLLILVAGGYALAGQKRGGDAMAHATTDGRSPVAGTAAC